jgi:predicted molibdopterin-dependent oxidoreductase YjgC
MTYFKYLTTGEEDINWGIFLNVAGKATIACNTVYPPKEHPSEYCFQWETGRILHEYQLNYITEAPESLKMSMELFLYKQVLL